MGIDYLHSVETKLHLAIPPADTGNAMGAIKRQLNKLLFKFDDKFQGIPLSYCDISFPKGKDNGRYLADQPWIHVDVLSKFLVFKPIVGAKIQGTIVKLTDSHVAVLILSLFNASISEDQMNKKYSFSYKDQQWVSRSGEALKEGDTIEFSISSFQHANGVVNIVGSL